MPRLQHLAMKHIKFWVPCSLPALTQLSITGFADVQAESATSANYQRLLGMLRSAPALKVLILRFPNMWIRGGDNHLDDVNDVVRLQCLTELRVEQAGYHQVSRLLSNLDLPVGVRFRIAAAFDHPATDDDLLSVFPMDTSRLPALDNLSFFEVTFDDELNQNGPFARGIGPFGTFHIVPAQSVSQAMRGELAGCIPHFSRPLFRHLSELRVHSWSLAVDEHAARSAFVVMPSLEKLVLSQESQTDGFSSIIKAVTPLSAATNEAFKFGNINTVPLANLHTLWLICPSTLVQICAKLVDCVRERHACLGGTLQEVLVAPFGKSTFQAGDIEMVGQDLQVLREMIVTVQIVEVLPSPPFVDLSNEVEVRSDGYTRSRFVH